MSNTKIVLNRQSDLILDNAQITNPTGIVKGDIPELVGDLSNLVVADTTESSARVAGDASLEVKHNTEMSTEVAARIAGDAVIQAEVDALEVEHAADVSTAAANLAAEASRAQAAEASNAAALAAEIAATDSDFAAMDAAYKAADASMETKHDAEMSAETSARVAGDVLLQTNIDAEKARIDAILDASTADSDSFAEIVSLINSVDTENDQAFAAYVLSNDTALSTEVARAGAAESSLEDALAAEISSTDADLASLEVKHDAEMSTEASTRVAVDEAQDAALSQEVIDRQTADNTIQANLNNEISDRISQDQLQATNLTAEASRAQAAEDSLATALANEVAATDSDFAAMDAAYKAADASIETKHDAEMSAETSRAQSVESFLSSEISTEKENRVLEDGRINNALSTETSRAELAESDLNKKIDRDLSTETAARVAGDVLLQSNIDAEKSRIDAILDASEADKDSFAEIVELINSVDTENDQAFASYVLSNDAALSTEAARAGAAEDSLATALDTERLERIASDEELEGRIEDIISNTDITSMDSFVEVSAEISSQVDTLNENTATLFGNDEELLNAIESNLPDMYGFNEDPDGVNTVFTSDVTQSEIVFLNGVMQLRNVDYTMTEGGEVTFTSAPAATDKINIYGISYYSPIITDPNAVIENLLDSYEGSIRFRTPLAGDSTVTAVAYNVDGLEVDGESLEITLSYEDKDPTLITGALATIPSSVRIASFDFLVNGVLETNVTASLIEQA
jgi:hypothetical protein